MGELLGWFEIPLPKQLVRLYLHNVWLKLQLFVTTGHTAGSVTSNRKIKKNKPIKGYEIWRQCFRLRGLGKKCCVCSVLTPRLSSDGGRARQARDLSLSWVEVRSALVQPFWVKYWALTSWETGSIKPSPCRYQKIDGFGSLPAPQAVKCQISEH